jgi:hypothetical protein
MEFERIYAYHKSGCFLEICQWCGEPCFAGTEVSLDMYLRQISKRDTMSLSRASIILQWHTSLSESVMPRQHTWTWHATMNLSSSYSFSSQKAHYTSLFFTGLHYWCWMTTCSVNLTSSTINTRLVCKGTLSLCFPKSPQDVRTVSNF